MHMTKITPSRLLRKKRLLKGLSQMALGRKLGVSHVFLSRMERDLCAIPPKRIRRLCAILDIDEEWMRRQIKNEFIHRTFDNEEEEG